ncbi:hypothetical protein BST81_19210 [Leptolyngbya sp. 'hensonii']|uniref:surface-adhesin E family protein n=1 Tax=Leptolyngbya sp. 'hensonii' TaxID=1922337 RepID=UPI00094F8CEB|nr:surface-adhesin E family protein [Leptolyngbya sp. 'hensonii']OLP16825.1 hypothetical protein BST81_19210 [Leptolyngbya sp. 'hensonii']
MKLALLLLTSFLLTCPLAAQAENWVWVDESTDGTRIYVDQDSIRRQGRFVWYWDLLRRKVPDAAGALSTRTYRSAECNIGTIRNRKVLKYDRNHQLLRSQTHGDRGPLFKVEPNSLAYAALQFACDTQT